MYSQMEEIGQTAVIFCRGFGWMDWGKPRKPLLRIPGTWQG